MRSDLQLFSFFLFLFFLDSLTFPSVTAAPFGLFNSTLEINFAGSPAIGHRSLRQSQQQVEPSAGCTTTCRSSLTFQGEEAKKYAVGSDIPSLSFKVKNSWAGLMPIARDDPSQALYFWLWGKDSLDPSKDTVIWLHGGPDCSALLGMMTQNGPFIYPSLTSKPIPNDKNSWTKTANIVYVEQPLGVGFSASSSDTGKGKKLSSEHHAEFASQFAGFLDNFFDTFPELLDGGGRVFFAGESYAGVYISHILHDQYTKRGNKHNIQGALIIDGLISDPAVVTDLVAYPFAVKHAREIGLTQGDLAAIKRQADQCHFTSYADDHLKYPAAGPLPDFNRQGCSTFSTFDRLARKRKADYNTYRVTVPPPFPEVPPAHTPLDNPALQRYINAPTMKWRACLNPNDANRFAPPPVAYPSYPDNILAKVIESSKSGITIMHGLEDGRIISAGTQIVLQNLTWNCHQGFDKAPHQTLIDTQGRASGTYVTERGLTLALIPHAGHMIALDAPSTAMAALQTLLGQRRLSG